MKKNNLNSIKRNCRAMLLALCIPIFSLPLIAQEFLYGPLKTPPKESAITFTGTENDGLIGRSSGKVYTITNITLANTTNTYWSIINESIKLSMDGSTYSAGENMTFNASLSNLSGGVLIWTGATSITTYDYGTRNTALASKFIVTVTNGSGTPISLVDPAISGLETGTGGAALIAGHAVTLKIRMQMLVSDNGSTYLPHLDYYDSKNTNGVLAYSSYNYGFYWENDPPVLENLSPASVDEGDTVTIATINLSASDLESADTSIYFIANPRETDLTPHNGVFYFDEEAMTYPDTFNLADIASGKLSYIHDGGESVKDSIALILMDSDSTIYKYADGDSVFYLPFTITPVDDSPEVAVNLGATVDEDAVLELSNNYLQTTDPESTADLVSYTLDPEANSDYPMNGTLFLNNVPLGDGGTFTQADINSGALKYDHDGSETLTDGFIFSVADEFGHKAMNGDTEVFFFNITVTPVNDLPHLTKLYPLEIEKGQTGRITNELLAAADAESDDDNIIFTIDPGYTVTNPIYGKVMIGDTELNDGGTFTMEDVNNNLVTFVHDGSDVESDFFVFRVSDHEGGIAIDGEYTDFHFNISVTNVNIETENIGEKIQLFPNPCNDYLNIKITNTDLEEIEINILDLLGKKVVSEQIFSKETIQINMVNQVEGIYFITLKGNSINRCLKFYKN